MKKKRVKKLVLTMALINLLQSGNYNIVKASDNKSYIFNEENNISQQYGGNQNDFGVHFKYLVKDPLIWEEIQKYFPIDNFDYEEEALFFL